MALNITIVLIFFACAVIGVYRGCGKILFDFFAILGMLFISSSCFDQASHSIKIVSDPHLNRAYVFGVIFVVGTILGLVISAFAYESILLNLGVMDKTLGFILGIAIAMILSHATVKTMALATPHATVNQAIASSSLGDEMLNFSNYHSVMDDLYDSTGGHRVVPTYN